MSGEAYTLPTGIVPVDQVEPVENIEEETEDVALSVMPEFKIDPEFRDLIPPLDPRTREDLKRSLQNEGCRDKLIICMLDGEYVLLDGHNRYVICTEHGIPFETTVSDVSSRTEAKIWIIRNQRSRRNLNESQRAMLAVALEALYAEEAKSRQGTRTDLGQKLDRSEAGRSAEKAAEDMGVSHQLVSSAKKVSTKGIPELSGLVNSGKVAVSTAARVTSLPAESQARVVEKANAQIEGGKRANLAGIIREIVPNTSKDDAELRFKKFKKSLVAFSKLLEGIETVPSNENLSEMQAEIQRISARLNEIGAKTPDSSSQNTAPVSEDSHVEDKDESIEGSQEGIVPKEDDLEDEFGNGGDPESFEDNLLDSMDDPVGLPESWEGYAETMENEDPIQ